PKARAGDDGGDGGERKGIGAKIKAMFTKHEATDDTKVGAALGEKCNPSDPHPCAGRSAACVDTKVFFFFHKSICATDGEKGAEGSPCGGSDQPGDCQAGLVRAMVSVHHLADHLE